MAWAAVATVGFLFVLPFLLAGVVRERTLAGDASAVPESGPYDWEFDDDFQALEHKRPA